MQADTFHLSRAESPPIESWDDDGDLQCLDDTQFHAISTTTSVTGSMLRSGHRDSISSRRSIRSDIDSNAGDEDWQLLLRDNDETATQEAIASARSAGIPIPDNVPKSALVSGSIKKLQSKQNKKSAIDDWSEDLEFPATDVELSLKSPEQDSFPESIHQIHTPLTTSPFKSRDSIDDASFGGSRTITQSSSARDIFREFDDHDIKRDLHDLQDLPTEDLTVSHLNHPQTPSMTSHTPPALPIDVGKDADDFEKDFEFPAHDMMLKLSPPPGTNTIPSINDDIWDNIDWADGSIGGRFSGGTKRDGRSTHSSSVSAFSPSASSCLTAETEDDGLDGLVLPDGPLDLEENLKKRKVLRTDSDEVSPKTQPRSKTVIDNHNFFDDLDVDDGNVFASMKPNVNRNVKRKLDRPMTPNRSEKTITFTNKTPSVSTRIPRLSGHNRSHTSLEPVSESGNPLIHFRRPQSRLTAHANRSSVGSIHTSPPVTPSGGRRSLGSRISREGITNDTSSHAQLLKAKRSVPSIRAPEEAVSGPPFQRPSSRQEGATMIPGYSSRPKTPVDRTTTDSRLANHRATAPFLPAGASQTQSHHVSIKYSRHFRRSDSENSTDSTLGQKSISRLSHTLRSDTPSRHHVHSASEGSNLTAKRTITRPARRRNYGDGSELESFDDLPTSAIAESRFVKTPVGHGAPRSARNRLPQSPPTAVSARTESPVPPMTSVAASRLSTFTPRFARDTNASRIAREQRIASLSLPSRNRESTPLAPLSTNWKGQQPSRQSDSMLTARSKKGKASRPGGSRPQLIRPMGSGVSEAKNVKGMQYNPNTYRWEGNENEVAEFDAINAPKSPKVAPALITNIGAIKGAQVVGGMVFDPQRMCWLKLASAQPDADKMAVVHDELEDVFAGLDDLQDRPEPKHHRRNISEASVADAAAEGGDIFDDQSGDSSEEWPITEEFDVGPEFVKRQRAEEDRWKRKVTKWVTSERQKLGDGWRWAIRDLVPSGS